MSLYYIAIVVPEPLQSEITAFKTAIHQRFGAKSALKSPAHITLFPPFRWEISNEKTLKTAIDDFSFSFFEKRGPLSINTFFIAKFNKTSYICSNICFI